MLRSAVIGVGAMGIHHARVYNELEGVELVAVADADARRAEAAGRRFKVPFYTDYRQMLDREKPDLVSIAVPTSIHHRVALETIARGVHLLVEKPIASSLGEAEEMVHEARRQGVKLAVGHIERFNPAVVELKRRLAQGEAGRIFLIHARRLGPFPERVQDMGVVIDLAAHDLDVMLYLLEQEVERVYAETARWVHARHEDLLAGLLYFRNGTLGLLDINRLTPTKVRELAVTGEKGMFLVNYLTQDLYFYENTYTAGNWDSLGLLKGVGEGNMVKLTIARKEPLRAELEAFVRAVESNEAPPVCGEDGMRVLALALQLLESGKAHRVLGAT
ncbi:MAG: Gfo/Idh/MocA family oxidoreductase [Chloroflexia bacterium]